MGILSEGILHPKGFFTKGFWPAGILSRRFWTAGIWPLGGDSENLGISHVGILRTWGFYKEIHVKKHLSKGILRL